MIKKSFDMKTILYVFHKDKRKKSFKKTKIIDSLLTSLFFYIYILSLAKTLYVLIVVNMFTLIICFFKFSNTVLENSGSEFCCNSGLKYIYSI